MGSYEDKAAADNAATRQFTLKLVKIVTAFMVLTMVGSLAGCPQYNVYSSRLEGEAELAKAEFSKRVAVQTAQAKKDSAQLEADSEVIRAGGVARANAIIGDSLKGNEAYLRYLFINELAQTKNQVIYVPTEAQLPILEAGKRPIFEPVK